MNQYLFKELVIKSQDIKYESGDKLAACPSCGATTITEIRYGLIRLTQKLKKEIDAGI